MLPLPKATTLPCGFMAARPIVETVITKKQDRNVAKPANKYDLIFIIVSLFRGEENNSSPEFD